MALSKVATYGAGVKDAKIILADASTIDINAIKAASGDPQSDSTDVNGDDERKATFVSNLTENLTISCNAVNFDALAALTGNTVTTVGSAPITGFNIPIGTDSEKNPPYVAIEARSVAKNLDGSSVDIIKRWEKVQVLSVKITQEGGSEVGIEMTGTAYQTATSIEGTALTPKRVATLSIGPVV